MLRIEVGSGEADRKSSKGSGSDNAVLDHENPATGNSLTSEFTDTVVAHANKLTASSGPDADLQDAIKKAAKDTSNRGEAADPSGKPIKPIADEEGQSMKSATATGEDAAKPNGTAKKSAVEEQSGSGKYKIIGVGHAFPSSAELLQGMKV